MLKNFNINYWPMILVMCISILACDKDDETEIHLDRYKNHSLTIVDGDGSPVVGADVYLYFLQKGDPVLISKQSTPTDGTVTFRESYLGDYAVEVGYLNSQTKQRVGEFELLRDSEDHRSYRLPAITELSERSLVLLQDGTLNGGVKASFDLITTRNWQLSADGDASWASLSISSGSRGSYRITLGADILQGASRGVVYSLITEHADEGDIPRVYVEQIGKPFFEDNLDWLRSLHTRPNEGDFLSDQTQTYMQGWGNNADYHGWTRYQFPGASFATYHGLSFFKISTGSRGGGVITPKMESIPDHVKEHVRLSFDIAKYIPPTGSAGSGRVVVDIIGAGTFQNGSTSMEFQAENVTWNAFNTKSEVVMGIDSDTQFVIRAVQAAGNQQFILDNIRVTKAVFLKE